MAYVNISLSTEAYQRLKGMKNEGESFSQEVLRLVNKPKLWELGGTLSEHEASKLEKDIQKMREKVKVREWQ